MPTKYRYLSNVEELLQSLISQLEPKSMSPTQKLLLVQSSETLHFSKERLYTGPVPGSGAGSVGFPQPVAAAVHDDVNQTNQK